MSRQRSTAYRVAWIASHRKETKNNFVLYRRGDNQRKAPGMIVPD